PRRCGACWKDWRRRDLRIFMGETRGARREENDPRSHTKSHEGLEERRYTIAHLSSKLSPFQLSLGAKIDQQPNTKPSGLEVIEYLSFLFSGKLIQCLKLNDDFPVTAKIGDVAFLKTMSFVCDGERRLRFKWHIS